MSDKNLYGYEEVEEDALQGGKYLNLKKKGDTVLIRLTTKPKRAYCHWIIGDGGKNVIKPCPGDSCEWCGKDVPTAEKIKRDIQYGWIVLDRNDGSKPKFFKGGRSIATQILEHSQDEQWGDPTTYDIKVERTEVKPQYYKVTGIIKSIGTPITEEEKKAIEEANIDLVAEMEGAVDSKSHNKEAYGGKELPPAEPVLGASEDGGVDISEDEGAELPF